MGGAPGPPALPAGGRGRRPGCRPTPRPARRSSRCSTDTTPLVEGLSIDEAFLDVGGLRRVSGTPRRDRRRGCGARCSSEVGLPITVGVARTKFLAKVASAVAKPDGLLVVPPDGELAFLHPLPVERLWGVGDGDGGQAARAGHHDGRRRSPSSPRPPWCRCSAGPRAVTCTPSRTTAIRGRSRSGGGDGRSASQRALGRSAAVADELDAALVVGLVDRVTRRMRAAGRVGPDRRCSGCASTTSRGRPGRTPSRAHRQTQPILATARDCWRAAMPLIERQGITLVGVAVGEPRRRAPLQLELAASTVPTAPPSTPRSTRCATGSGSARSPGPCCSAATRACRCPCSRTNLGVWTAKESRLPTVAPTRSCTPRTMPAPRSCSAMARAAGWDRAISSR